MKFQQESVPIRDVPIGVVCIGELDYDNNTLNPVKYIPVEKRNHRVSVIKIDPKTASRTEEDLIDSMRVCPQEMQ